MPHLSSNIPSTSFYDSIFSEVLGTLGINEFIPRPYYLFPRMITQGGNRATLTKQLKIFPILPKCFQKIGKTH